MQILHWGLLPWLLEHLLRRSHRHACLLTHLHVVMLHRWRALYRIKDLMRLTGDHLSVLPSDRLHELLYHAQISKRALHSLPKNCGLTTLRHLAGHVRTQHGRDGTWREELATENRYRLAIGSHHKLCRLPLHLVSRHLLLLLHLL